MSHDKKSANLRRQIDENLRRVYRQDKDEEIPDRFEKLLAQLKASDKVGKSGDHSDD